MCRHYFEYKLKEKENGHTDRERNDSSGCDTPKLVVAMPVLEVKRGPDACPTGVLYFFETIPTYTIFLYNIFTPIKLCFHRNNFENHNSQGIIIKIG